VPRLLLIDTRASSGRYPGCPPGRTIRGIAFDRITVDPQRMGGVPCIRDLRVTVSMVPGELAAGASIDDLVKDYPVPGACRRARSLGVRGRDCQ